MTSIAVLVSPSRVETTVGVSVDLLPPIAVPLAASAQAGLGIRLLGELQLTRAGIVVSLPASKRTRALLGYLVATGTAQLRQTLCDLLWDGPDDPRGALRWSLSKLRSVTDDEFRRRLDADREHVGFVADDTDIDTRRVQVLFGADAMAAPTEILEAGATLLQGEFLDGLDLPACHRFHHWCMAERERYGVLRRRVLTALTERLGANPSRALPHARALVTADPLSETAHANLVRVLTQCGRQQDAELHCDRTADLLKREIGAGAAEALRAALREARRKRPEAQAARLVAAVSEPVLPEQALLDLAEPVLDMVGREAERRRILAITAGLSRAQPMLLVLGEPGIGKTRLLEVLGAAAKARGARVAVGRCFEAETVHPYGCFRDALRELPEALVPEELRSGGVLPGLAEAPRAVADGDRGRLLTRVAEMVQTLTGPAPFVLVIDDVQWMDEASAALLHFLVRSAFPGLLLAGAARPGEIDDNPWVKRLLQSLGRDGLLERCPLEPLSSNEVATLTGLRPREAAAAIDVPLQRRQPVVGAGACARPEGGCDLADKALKSLVADRVARLSEEERDAWRGRPHSAARSGRNCWPPASAWVRVC